MEHTKNNVHKSKKREEIIDLKALCERLKASPEMKAKKDISLAADFSYPTNTQKKPQSLDDKYAQPGDDCSALKTENGYQLIAMEGMLPSFVKSDPKAAAWSAVMANVSDISAMGGRASAIINAFWHNNEIESRIILSNLKKACDTWGLIFAGGHSSLNKNHTGNLAVGILGFAKKLLSCHHIRPEQQLFMLTDLRGQWHRDLPYWGCLAKKSKNEIQAQWNIPAEIAEKGLAVAAKDISNGGILGTLLMMLELTGCGADIDVNAIKKPDTDLLRWMQAFQSYGFLMAVEPNKADEHNIWSY